MQEAHESTRSRSRVAFGIAWPLALAVVVLSIFESIGASFWEGWTLYLGSAQGLANSYTNFLKHYAAFGSLAALALVVGLARLTSVPTCERALARLVACPRAPIVGAAMLIAFAFPALLRLLVMESGAVTDDESAYRFMGEVLATGRVAIPSPPGQAFFDRSLMINNGQLYAQYFVGWPALMVPGVLVGAPGLVNPLLLSLTVPAVYGLLTRAVSEGWARLGVALFVSAPMFLLGAATLMSHTSCTFALAWTLWFVARAREEGAPWWAHLGVGLAFSVAFFIRPTAALGVGAPALLWWFARSVRLGLQGFAAAALACAIPASLLGAAFFAVNKAQNGAYTKISYQAELAYRQVRAYKPKQVGDAQVVHNFRFDSAARVIDIQSNAVQRLNAALLGWPASSLLAAPLAGLRGLAGLLVASTLGFFAVHLFLADVGVDSFAPVHFFEVGLPLLLLVVIGLARLDGWVQAAYARRQRARARWLWARPDALVGALTVALLGVAAITYTPRRAEALGVLARATALPEKRARELGIHNAAIFVSGKFVQDCAAYPHHNYVFWPPSNDPALSRDLLWFNHMTIAKDRAHVDAYFRDRTGYLMIWDGCVPVFDELPPPGQGAALAGLLTARRRRFKRRSPRPWACPAPGWSLLTPLIVGEPRRADADAPVAYWPVDGASERVADAGGRGWDATLLAARPTEGPAGLPAIELGGEGPPGLVVERFLDMPSGSFSIELWLYQERDTPGRGALLRYDVDGEVALELRDTRALTIAVGPEQVYKTNVDLATGAWNQIVIVRDAEAGNLRVFGNTRVTAGPKSFTAVPELPPGGTLRIGPDGEDGARYAGRLAEVAIYDRALSRQEVRAHFLAIQCGL
ncbi:MAG: LamG-like jellyroll fold domain-containing protein [Nannocystaceae bacterium]